MKKKIYIYLLFSLLCFSANTAYSQGTNPFEVKSRASTKSHVDKIDSNVFNLETKQKPIEENNNSISNNPFEIGKKQNKAKTISTKVVQNVKKNTNQFKSNSDFLFWVILFMLIFVAVLFSFNRNIILKIIKTIWYYNHTNILFRNFGSREFLFYLFLFINFIVNLTIFIYLFLNKNHNLSGIDLFIKIFGFVALAYIIKHLSIALFNSIFSSLKSIGKFNFTIFLFNINLGLFLIPINLLVAYGLSAISPFFIIIGMILIGILYILRLFRGLLLTYDYLSISIFHFFLYLCAFEILPLLVISKYFANYL